MMQDQYRIDNYKNALNQYQTANPMNKEMCWQRMKESGSYMIRVGGTDMCPDFDLIENVYNETNTQNTNNPPKLTFDFHLTSN